MELSICVDPRRTWAEATAIAHRVDMAGWYAVYACDHFMSVAAESGGDEPFLECWTLLSGLAAVTTSVRLGSLVLGNTYRHPAVVANMAATLDHASSGRVVLGLGAGWQPSEHTAYGIDLGTAAGRVAALDDACTVIRALLSRPRSTVSTPTYRLLDAACEPKPVQPRLPFLIGGGGEQLTLAVAAKHAEVWHHWADPDVLRGKGSVLDRHCDRIGRDPATVRRASGGTVALRSRAGPGPSFGGADVYGSPDEVLTRLAEFGDAGIGEFIVRDDAGRVSAARALAQIDELSSVVVPALS